MMDTLQMPQIEYYVHVVGLHRMIPLKGIILKELVI